MNKMKRRIRIYCSLFWLLLSILTCQQAIGLKLGKLSQPGPGLFPFSVAIVMGILSMVALILSLRGKEKIIFMEKNEPIRWWSIVIIIFLLIAYGLSLEKIGFLINTFLLITILLKVVELQPWKTSLLGGFITALTSNLVFNVLLRAQIPSGILGF